MRGGIQAALQKIFGEVGRAAHVRLDHHVIDYRILRRAAFVRMQKFVEAFVGARELAGMLRTHQIDALHPADHVLVVAPVAPQPHEILGELQATCERFFVRAAADGPRSVVELLDRNFPRRELLENLLDALGLFAVHKRLLQLLQVDRRAVFAMDSAQFVAGQHVKQQIALFEPVHPFFQQPRAHFGAGFAFADDAAASNRRRALAG